jgi:peptidoglycan/LPS O-acetylase OafA/YrhL
LALLAVVQISNKRRGTQTLLLLFGLVCAVVVWMSAGVPSSGIIALIGIPIIGLGILFSTGALLGIAFERYPMRPNVWFSGLVTLTWVIIGPSGPFGLAFWGIAVILLGLSMTNKRLSDIGKTTDFSYGLYLYHMPIMQGMIAAVFVVWSPTLVIFVLAPLCAVITLLFACLSWRFIERPSMNYARQLSRH